MNTRPLREMPTVLTCFAFRDEYYAELDGMLATVKQHHPDWPQVIGRGGVRDGNAARFEVETPSGQFQWSLPVPLHLSGGEDDWRKITRMKGWWLDEVWCRFGEMNDASCNRIMWLDADARLNAPLDFELDPAAEIIAGPWWDDPNNGDYDTITSGVILFQGASNGPVAKILKLWREACLEQIQNLPAPTVPWLEGDQEVLTKALAQFPEEDSGFKILKLDHDKYCGIPMANGEPQPDALIDHWMMSAKMGRSGKRGPDWPPPEHIKRASRK